MQNVKNIIFDLGGVLFNIDFRLTEKAFTELGVKDFASYFTQFHSNPLFARLETGVDTDFFYDAFRKETGLDVTDEQIRHAWNALLLDFRKESMAMLPLLRKKYKLYLLSNTNEIHIQEFLQRFEQTYPETHFEDLFDGVYYSHRIGRRKPNADAFEFILHKHGLSAEETLFIDDSINNIEAADQLGIKTIHLKPGMRVEELGL